MKKTKTRTIVRCALIASLYTAVSLVLAPIAFGAVQARVSEAFTLLPVLVPDAVVGVTLGCFLTNLVGVFTGANVLGALVVGYVFQYLFTYILPALGEMIGSEALSSSMLSNEKTAWIAIMIVCCWQNIAMTTIIYISGLQTVPEDVYEAGSLDGATGWKQFRHLTFPLIIPFFTINMVLCGKNFLMVFDQIMAMTKGGPAQSTESISYLIYNNGMSGGQFGFQSANAVIFFIVIVAISAAQMIFSGRKEEQL